MKDNERYSKFCKILNDGFDYKDARDFLKLPKTTYHRYKNRFKAQSDYKYKHVPFDMEEYFKIVMNGYHDKDELSSWLGVSKKTLIKYEKEILPDFSKYLLMCDVHIDDIAKILHVGQNDMMDYLDGFYSVKDVLKQLEAIKEYASFSPFNLKSSHDFKNVFLYVCFILKEIIDTIEGEKNLLYSKSGVFRNS